MSHKLTAATNQGPEDAEMDLSPMIDMVFLIIIFFMVTSKIIKHRIDPNVKIPVGSNAQRAQNPVPTRIVVNIYPDGSIHDESGALLPDEDAIFDYVTKKKIQIKSPTGVYQIFLRGDQTAIVKEAKRVIQASGRAGVNDIVFGAYPTS
jgi:biopolymer transport protein ExbD